MAHAWAVVAEDSVGAAVEAVIAAGRYASARHWVPATSGNFSVRIDETRIAITRSGVDKGALTPADILIQPIDGPLLPGSSAEAALHVRQYADDPGIRAIFHIHGLYSTVISRAHTDSGAVVLAGWELLEGAIRHHDPRDDRGSAGLRQRSGCRRTLGPRRRSPRAGQPSRGKVARRATCSPVMDSTPGAGLPGTQFVTSKPSRFYSARSSRSGVIRHDSAHRLCRR